MKREPYPDLSAFAAVADERSFTRAAARLGTSQSAVSHAVRRLEEHVGIRLLARTTRSVVPTEAGERLLAALLPAFDAIEREIDTLRSLGSTVAGTLRITVAEEAARTILWPALERLLPQHPGLNVDVMLDSALVDIIADRFDAGIRIGEAVPRDMVAVRIGPHMRMAAVASPDYLACHPAPQTPQELAGHRCINLRMRSLGGFYAWEFERDGRETIVRVGGQVAFNDASMIVRAACAGFGIAFLPDSHVERELADGRLLRMLEEWCPPFPGYHLYYPSRRQISPALALLVDALRYRG